MKKIFFIASTAFISLLTMEACKKSDSNLINEQAKNNLAINILGKWKVDSITTIPDGAPTGTTTKGNDNDFYIFNTDTLGSNKIGGVTESFVYKILDGNNIKIKSTDCPIQINGTKMRLERYFGAPFYQKLIINFSKDEIGSLYEILTGEWKIIVYKKTQNNIVSFPSLHQDPNIIFNNNNDTILNYQLGAGPDREVQPTIPYKITGAHQFIFDTLQTNVTIGDPTHIRLNMVSTVDTTNKKEFSLQRKQIN